MVMYENCVHAVNYGCELCNRCELWAWTMGVDYGCELSWDQLIEEPFGKLNNRVMDQSELVKLF